jgi:hypothetical protein
MKVREKILINKNGKIKREKSNGLDKNDTEKILKEGF